ncbi:MAG: urate hydroxylase PuuD [Actinobacteria bacterium]|nr:urate hydroxylase PuuD [Actinomycetota bacterium]MDA2952700.1 urate hydroxylase PuuD [Actinomycetota bacterium]
MELLSQDYIYNFGFRWLHILVGIAWIGLLYYFNLVQVPGLADYGDEGKARNITIDKIARRALWWFRYAALATLATGILITGQPGYWKNFLNGGGSGNGHDAAISVGMIMATLMAANVWMIIWKNQKVVLANAANVLAGGEANADAPTAGRKALLASRQNTIFSVSMLFFMVGAAHFYNGSVFAESSSSSATTFLLISVVITALLQLNALGIFGGIKAGNKMLWMYENHKNAIITSFVLWLVLWILSEVILG